MRHFVEICLCFVVCCVGGSIFIDSEYFNDTQSNDVLYAEYIDNDCVGSQYCLMLYGISSVKVVLLSEKMYGNMWISYDIQISSNWNDNIDEGYYDRGYISYECNDGIIRTIKEYNSNDAGYIGRNDSIYLGQYCDGSRQIIIYLNTFTYESTKTMRISNIELYGGYQMENQYVSNTELLYHERFGNLKHWHRNSNSELVNDTYCLKPPCVRLRDNGYIISEYISTLGHENIAIIFDINLGANHAFGKDNVIDNFTINYYCHDNIWIKLMEYSNEMYSELVLFQMGVKIYLNDCNNVANLRIMFESQTNDASAWIDNVFIFGNRINDEPSVAPTIMSSNPSMSPSYRPTITPTTFPTQNRTNMAITTTFNINTEFNITTTSNITKLVPATEMILPSISHHLLRLLIRHPVIIALLAILILLIILALILLTERICKKFNKKSHKKNAKASSREVPPTLNNMRIVYSDSNISIRNMDIIDNDKIMAAIVAQNGIDIHNLTKGNIEPEKFETGNDEHIQNTFNIDIAKHDDSVIAEEIQDHYNDIELITKGEPLPNTNEHIM